MSGENLAAVKKRLQNLYKKAIEDRLGVIVSIDKDGDITFKYGAIGELLLSIDAEDVSYFRLVDKVEIDEWSEENEINSLKTANKVNGQIRCVALFVTKEGNNLVLVNSAEAYVSIENEMPSRDFVESALERYAWILNSSRNLFVEEYGGKGESV